MNKILISAEQKDALITFLHREHCEVGHTLGWVMSSSDRDHDYISGLQKQRLDCERLWNIVRDSQELSRYRITQILRRIAQYPRVWFSCEEVALFQILSSLRIRATKKAIPTD